MMPQFVLDLLFLPPEGSTVSASVDALHVFVISFTMMGSFGIFLVAGYFVIRYPRRHEGQLTESFRASAKSEAAIVASILSLFVLWWVIGYRQFVAMESPPEDAMPIYVSAKQWMWKFTYPDGRSANDVLAVPEGRAVKLVMTSRDVIHSFYVPGFRLKQDVLPGRYTTLWFRSMAAGEYPILCAEYCGVSHSMMRGSVVVLGVDDYEKWLRAPTQDASGGTDLASVGARIAGTRECLACHTIDGQPHIGPTWVGLYGSWVTLNDGRRVVADEAYLTRSMMEPAADVVAGFRPVMPTFFGVLPQPEVAALVEYIKSLRDVRPESGVSLREPPIDRLETPDGGAPGAGVPILPRLP